MARWLGIDHGTRRLGVAVGDAETGIATPLRQLPADERCWEAILELAGEYAAVGIVVGWPLNADGTEGAQGRLARKFAAKLAGATGLDVRMWDERLSSFEADQRLKGTMTRKRKKRRHDAVAAAAFLEDFFRGQGAQLAPRPADARARAADEKAPAGDGEAGGEASEGRK